jgi:hypothetical protein
VTLTSKTYLDLCTKKLSILVCEIEIRGHLNILDLNIHAENFYARLLNLIFGYSLSNLNATTQNAAGIDLIDHTAKVVLQVSATATKAKVEASLAKDLTSYVGYSFKFVALTTDASSLKSKTFVNPHKLAFSPTNDIFDVKAISGIILALDLSRQQQIYQFLKTEMLSLDIEVPSDSNLATLINILGGEDLRVQNQTGTPIPFNVDSKITFNNLNTAAQIIEDHKIYYHKVENLYSTFDQAGKNKSTSVLSAFNNVYLRLSMQFKDDELFFEIVQHMIDVVKNSSNYVAMTLEELELCINILTADAFIRCRIFKNPKVPANAVA